MPILLLVLSYHALVIFPVSRSTVNLSRLKQLKSFNAKIDGFASDYLKRVHWFLPQITLYGEVLVPLDKYQFEIIQDANKKKQPLLTYVSVQNKQRRNFRLMILENCILPNTDFSYAELQGVNLFKANLQGINLFKANLQGADLQSINFQGAVLLLANLNEVIFFKVDFQGVKWANSNLQGADLIGANFQGGDFFTADFQGANLMGANFQGALLYKIKLQGANLMGANFQGVDLQYVDLQGADLFSANLQGVYSNNGSSNFSNQKGKSADITGISTKVLTAKKSEEIMTKLQTLISDKDQLKEIRARLEKAVGKDPIEWVENQQGIKLGVISEEDYNKIEKSATNPQARKNMGLPPLAED